jgi:hypothetical protein
MGITFINTFVVLHIKLFLLPESRCNLAGVGGEIKIGSSYCFVILESMRTRCGNEGTS